MVKIFVRFRRNTASHDNDFLPAYFHTFDIENGILRMERPAGKLKRIGDAVHVCNAGQEFQLPCIEIRFHADCASTV